ncbi:MAG: hypothetical protein AAGD25_26180 [Cyanobacteria bacterium P01_F01_bin.150]
MVFTPELIDGLTLIGLITLMSVTVCPLLMWALTFDLEGSLQGPSTTFNKTAV